MRANAENRGVRLDRAAERAAKVIGRRLGRWSWNATGGGVRMLLVAAVAAAFAEAFAPNRSFSAYVAIFMAADVLSWSSLALVKRGLRWNEAARVARETEEAE